MTGDSHSATILVVDDEEAYLDAYVRWLADEYAVRTATRGEEALSRIDDAVDVVFLDRRMPGLSGDEVLARIRERGIDCRVAMLTAIEPDLDIVDMPFDEYLLKPVSAEELRSTVECLLVRAALDAQVRECFALAAKKSTLEANVDEHELASSEGYAELCERLATVEAQVHETLRELVSSGQIAVAYHEVGP